MRRYLHRTFSKKARRSFFVLMLALALLVLVLAAAAHMRPILTSLATSRVANTVTRIVSSAVNEAVYDGSVDYDSLITLEHGADGQIVALKSNMAEFNRLQSDILANILERMGEVDTRELSIPLGSLTGTPLLAGRGPAIRVRMQSVGSPSARFENEFTDAGINQTRHRIVLVVDVSAGILLPGFSTGTRVSNEFSVAETVIVGNVPQSYTYFRSDDVKSTAEEYVLNG